MATMPTSPDAAAAAAKSAPVFAFASMTLGTSRRADGDGIGESVSHADTERGDTFAIDASLRSSPTAAAVAVARHLATRASPALSTAESVQSAIPSELAPSDRAVALRAHRSPHAIAASAGAGVKSFFGSGAQSASNASLLSTATTTTTMNQPGAFCAADAVAAAAAELHTDNTDAFPAICYFCTIRLLVDQAPDHLFRSVVEFS